MKQPTTRQLMVKGSEWTAKEDFEFFVHSKCGWTERENYRDLFMATPTTVKVPKGTVLKILDKSNINITTYGFDNKGQRTRIFLDGLFYPVKVDGEQFNEGGYWIEFKQLNNNVELLKGIDVHVFYLFSPSQNKYIERYDYLSRTLSWTDKLSKALKKKRKQDATQFLLEHTGYYNQLDTYGGGWYEAGGLTLDLPDDLEIHEINKDTKALIGNMLCKPYIETMHRMKPLVVEYGSSARDVFKHLEAKKLSYPVILFFKDNVTDLFEVSAPIKMLKESFKALKLSRDSYVMKSNSNSVCIAFANKNDALVAKLSLSTDGTICKIVDTTTMMDLNE